LLEQFHVPENVAVRVDHEKLHTTVTALLTRVGVPGDDAALCADALVSADLRAVESHGVSNMLRSYMSNIGNGHINPVPNWKITRETASCATIDCDTGLGTILAQKAMDIAIEKARKTGAGLVSMGNGRHLGMAAYHAMKAIPHDMIGQCMTACGPSVLVTDSAENGMGTNPIAVAAPAGEEPPFVFDAAMSMVANNKIGLARRLGIPVEPGWIADDDGVPIMERVDVPEDFKLLPAGSTRELGSHKTFSMGVMVDILGGLLNGSPAGVIAPRGHNNHFVAAYSIDAFIDVAEFKAAMDDYLRALRNLRPARGKERVIYAGVPEAEAEIDRRANGIPLHPEVTDWFKSACAEHGVDFDLLK
jgi:LDH2 family malate/lactate/ureidoglycolate dehydrogenase